MKILIIGAGYVGLTSASVFANQHEVVVVDNDKQKIKRIKNGENVISEPDLHLSQKKLQFSTSLKKSMKENVFDFIFLCVGTPLTGKTGFTNENQKFDLSMLENSIEEIIITNKKQQDLNLIIKSTVLPGTAFEMRKKANEYAKKHNVSCHIEIISNPEFLREGCAVYDVRYPSRVVIGLNKKSSYYDLLKKKMEEFYKIHEIQPLIFVDNETAELSKLAANAFLANKVSFMNEQMQLAKKAGAKIDDIVKILEMDSRIGKYINPGIGYGGYCLPKDVLALKSYAEEKEVESNMLKSIHETNMKHMKLIVNTIESFILQHSPDFKVGIYGVAFKNNTRDSREAPALYIAQELSKRGVKVILIDEKQTLHEYHGEIEKGDKNLKTDIALICNKSGYELFRIHDNIQLVIDPLRLLSKSQRNRVKALGEYSII